MATGQNSRDITFGSFFRYHGWLSPGVRLFRLLSFPAKATLIAVAFCLPIAGMFWLLWSSALSSIHNTRNEVAGLAYAQEIVTYIEANQKLRSAAGQKNSALTALQGDAARALEKLREHQQNLATPEVTSATFGELELLHRNLTLSPTGPTPDATFTAYSTAIDKALELIRGVADASSMTLDPVIDTYHLINLAVILGPQQQEYLVRLRDLSRIILEPQDGREPDPSSIKAAERAVALISVLDTAYEASYLRGIASFPDVAASIDMKGTDQARDAMLASIEKNVLAGVPSGNSAAMMTLGDASVSAQTNMNKAINQRLELRLQQRITELKRNMATQLTLTLLSIGLALYMMLAFYKVMRGGLREVAGHLEQITQGNLTVAPTPWGADEAAELMTTMGGMQTSLRRIAQVVLDSAADVKTASEDIAAASQDLSLRTEASAQDIQQTSQNMATIAANVKHTATMVAGTTAIVSENAASATQGAKVIRQVVDTMEDIRRSSNQIGEIISVIDGIAFQTNILALNAAVEAARAGEQGRGFAVVASEVRALAGRSAEAAKEIKRLISSSIDQVEAGNRVVKESGDTIEVIVVNADQVNALMKEISVATKDQTDGVESVEAAVHSLDRNTQQNATLVQQTAASASALADQAQRLSDEVSFFKLK